MMGDEEHRPAANVLFQVGQKRFFGLHIQGRCGFIQQQDPSGTKQRARDGDPLRLAFGNPRTAHAKNRIQPFGQLQDKIRGSHPERFHEHLLPGIGIPYQQVAPDGAAEQRVALRDIHEIRPRGGGWSDWRNG